MARWSDATLVQLGGFNKNVVIDEILYGEDNTYPITYFVDSGATVTALSGNTVTYTGAPTRVFTVGYPITFGSTSTTYSITAVTTTTGGGTVTISGSPSSTDVATGTSVQYPLDMTGYTFSCRLLEHVTSGISETSKGVADIGQLSPKQGATQLNLDTFINQTNLLQGTITLQIPDSGIASLSDIPVIDSTTPPIYTGFISYTAPAAGSIQAQTKKQRICWVLRSDGAVDGLG